VNEESASSGRDLCPQRSEQMISRFFILFLLPNNP
jgi:hypothetical protein